MLDIGAYLCKGNPIVVSYVDLSGTYSHTSEEENPRSVRQTRHKDITVITIALEAVS